MVINIFALGYECKSVCCMHCKAKINNFSAGSESKSVQMAIDSWNRRDYHEQ